MVDSMGMPQPSSTDDRAALPHHTTHQLINGTFQRNPLEDMGYFDTDPVTEDVQQKKEIETTRGQSPWK